MPTKAKPKRKLVKLDGKVIGYVAADHDVSFLRGYWSAFYYKEARATDMVQEYYRRDRWPKKPWHVKTKGGVTMLVLASTNDEAFEIASHRVKRIVLSFFEPANVRIAYEEEIEGTAPLNESALRHLHLGLINPPEAT
jgi:hypothetical protein